LQADSPQGKSRAKGGYPANRRARSAVVDTDLAGPDSGKPGGGVAPPPTDAEATGGGRLSYRVDTVLAMSASAAEGASSVHVPPAPAVVAPEAASPLVEDGPSWDLFDEIPSDDAELVEVVRSLLAAEPRPFLPVALDEDRADGYDLSDLDEYYLGEVRRGAVVVLRDGYVSEAEWGADIDVGLDAVGDFQADHHLLADRISAHYGAPLDDAEELRYSDSGSTVQWQVGESKLVLEVFANYGDGNIELHLWLAVVTDPADD
jgi:hypothetical protein